MRVPRLYQSDTRYNIFISQFHSLYILNTNTLTTYIDTLMEMGVGGWGGGSNITTLRLSSCYHQIRLKSHTLLQREKKANRESHSMHSMQLIGTFRSLRFTVGWPLKSYTHTGISPSVSGPSAVILVANLMK